MPPSLDTLNLFAAVAESGSFTGAAEKLSIPTATLSRKITQLERELRVQLFVRNTRNVRLSPDGEAFYAQILPALAQIGAAVEQLADTTEQVHGIHGTIRLTAPVDFANYFLVEPFAQFLQHNPDIELQLLLNTDMMNLVSEQLDLAIRIGRLADSGLYARHLFDLRLQLYAAPDYLAGLPTITTPDQLSLCNVLLLKRNRITRTLHFSYRNQPCTQAVRGNLCASDMSALISFCIAGTGVALLPQNSVQRAVTQGKLIPILPDCLFTTEPVHALTPEKNPPARVRRLIESLKEQSHQKTRHLMPD